MKTLTCDLCDHKESAESFEEWMEKLKPHYAERHADFMSKQESRPEEEQQQEMQKWMEENKKRFEEA